MGRSEPRAGGWGKGEDIGHRNMLSAVRFISSGHLMCSMVIIANNTVLYF